MTMNKLHTRRLMLALVVALLITACGLKDDLYFPDEEAVAVPAESQNTEDTEESDPSAVQSP
jgi:predicted small lipoprotein YifL